MKIGISIFGSGRDIPSLIFPPCGEGYGMEVKGKALGWGGTFVQFLPDGSSSVLTIPTNYEWVKIRVIE